MKMRPFSGPVERKLYPPEVRIEERPPVPLARTTLGDDEVVVEVLSGPNAIGMVSVAYRGERLSRYHGRLMPQNEAAREFLGRADRFVQRDARTAENPREPERPQIDGWTLEEVELLRDALINEAREHERLVSSAEGRRREVFKKIWLNKAAALRYVNGWLKRERVKRTAAGVGLSDEERRNPDVLIWRASKMIVLQHSEIFRLTGKGLDGAKDLANALRDYLVHFARTRVKDMPEPELVLREDRQQ